MLGLHVIQYPTGRFGFVGRVPVNLAYSGTFNEDDAAALVQCGPRIARLGAERGGRTMVNRSFETEQAARDFAAEQGFTVGGAN